MRHLNAALRALRAQAAGPQGPAAPAPDPGPQGPDDFGPPDMGPDPGDDSGAPKPDLLSLDAYVFRVESNGKKLRELVDLLSKPDTEALEQRKSLGLMRVMFEDVAQVAQAGAQMMQAFDEPVTIPDTPPDMGPDMGAGGGGPEMPQSQWMS